MTHNMKLKLKLNKALPYDGTIDRRAKCKSAQKFFIQQKGIDNLVIALECQRQEAKQLTNIPWVEAWKCGATLRHWASSYDQQGNVCEISPSCPCPNIVYPNSCAVAANRRQFPGQLRKLSLNLRVCLFAYREHPHCLHMLPCSHG